MEYITTLFSLTWDFLTTVRVPGTDMTFSALYIGLFVVLLGITIFRTFVGIGRDPDKSQYYTYNRFDRKRR